MFEKDDLDIIKNDEEHPDHQILMDFEQFILKNLPSKFEDKVNGFIVYSVEKFPHLKGAFLYILKRIFHKERFNRVRKLLLEEKEEISSDVQMKITEVSS